MYVCDVKEFIYVISFGYRRLLKFSASVEPKSTVATVGTVQYSPSDWLLICLLICSLLISHHAQIPERAERRRRPAGRARRTPGVPAPTAVHRCTTIGAGACAPLAPRSFPQLPVGWAGRPRHGTKASRAQQLVVRAMPRSATCPR